MIRVNDQVRVKGPVEAVTLGTARDTCGRRVATIDLLVQEHLFRFPMPSKAMARQELRPAKRRWLGKTVEGIISLQHAGGKRYECYVLKEPRCLYRQPESYASGYLRPDE